MNDLFKNLLYNILEMSDLGEICTRAEWTRHKEGGCKNGYQSYGGSGGERIRGETETGEGGGRPGPGMWNLINLLQWFCKCNEIKSYIHAYVCSFVNHCNFIFKISGIHPRICKLYISILIY